MKGFVWPQYLVEPQYIEGCFAGRGQLIWFFSPRPDYPELMHPRSQGTRVEAQDRRGPFLSFDAPPGFRKDLENLVPFRLFQGPHGGGK